MTQTSNALAEDETAKAHYLLLAIESLSFCPLRRGQAYLQRLSRSSHALCALRMSRSRDAMSEFEAALKQEPGNKEIEVKLEPPGGRVRPYPAEAMRPKTAESRGKEQVTASPTG